jgi:methyl-accepting chemotaxis protein
MTSISNMKIGRKIAFILGGIILLLTGLSALSLWGTSTNQKAATTLVQRMTKARLAATVEAETSAVTAAIERMVIEKKASEELVNEVREHKKSRVAALEQFKALADTPTSIKHGADMAELVQSASALSAKTVELAVAGRFADAAKGAIAYSKANVALRAKTQEATQFQDIRAAEAEKASKETSSTIWISLLVGSLIAIAAAIFGGIFLARGITVPLAKTVTLLDAVASGDISKDVMPDLLARGDEIGTLSKAVQTMSVNLRDVIKGMTGGIQVLSSSSAELSANSSQMSGGSRDASGKAHAVAAAAEQMTSNVVSVAAGMEQTSTNLGSVASATEQMTATIGEIAGNSEKARRITEDATRQAARISEQMNQLGAAAQQIGKVTETITEISSQTNLLALNATIEAARAGSAGKGFAVVANEIKELAQQTARATEDIKARIAGVQSSTAGGIAEIDKVSQIIHDVSDIVSSIAAAIEEQSTTTKDIARNIAEASTGVRDANKRVSEASLATAEIAREIAGVDQAAGQMADGSQQVQTSATELSKVAEQLQVTVQRFKV